MYTETDPEKLTENHLKALLTTLAVKRNVSKSTQRVAFNALLFLYKYVLKEQITSLKDVVPASGPRRLPVVLTREEITRIFSFLDRDTLLAAEIIYGCGLRVNECLSLRIQDINLEAHTVIVRFGKGDKDRVTILPTSLDRKPKERYSELSKLYEQDRKDGLSGVALPHALEKKYPNAGKKWGWFWLFPSYKISTDPRSGIIRRHHLYHSTIQKSFHTAVLRARIAKRASVHTLGHSFATHLLESGYNIRTIQSLLGHSNVNTTMIYTHVAKSNMLGVQSPLYQPTPSFYTTTLSKYAFKP